MEQFQQKMKSNGSSDIARAGVLLGLMVVLVIIALFVPIIGPLGLFVIPTIFYLILKKNGLKMSILSLMSLLVMIGILVGPIEMLTIGLMKIVPAFVMATLLHYRKSAAWAMLNSAIAYFVGIFLALVVSSYMLEFSLTPGVLEKNARDALENPYVMSFMIEVFGEASYLAGKQNLHLLVNYFYGFLLFGFVSSSIVLSFISYKVMSYLSYRFTKEHIPTFVPFPLWDFPKILGFMLITVLVCSGYLMFKGLIAPPWMSNVFIFMFLMSGYAMLIQGLAVVKYLLDYRGTPPYMFYVLLAATLSLSFVGTTVVFLGLADLFLNYRRLPRKS